MSLKTKLADDRVVVAVDVGVHTIHALEDLSDHAWERLREWDTFESLVIPAHEILNSSWDVPILLGNTASLSMLLWTHPIKCSIYCGAGILVGRLYVSESCQRYSNLCRYIS